MLVNSAPFRIRRAEPQDVEAMFGLICELADYENLRHQVTGSVAALKSCLFGSDPVAEALVAEVEGSLVGQALFFTTFSTFLTQPGHYLEDLYVQPAYRQQGIGQALLVALAQLTLERGYGRLEWVVLDWNIPAIEFYRKMGAELLTDWIPNRLTGEALQRLAQG
ncbi:MAG: GNAT family N-acetyltransferase [Synechococcaceae cyanobacterium SM2_3_2]|nr:GNAT family N-acetyltransferase [Synechococcaceae cyanobacterium SM2_3_2]